MLWWVKPPLPLIPYQYETSIFTPQHSDDTKLNHYMLTGGERKISSEESTALIDMITRAFSTGGTGGGGSGSLVIDLKPSEKDQGLQVFKSDGSKSVIPFYDIKATNLEYYIYVNPVDTTKFVTIPFVKGKDVKVPLGGVKMAGRNLYITLDTVNNRLIIPVGNTRLSARLSMPVRFNPSIKDTMMLETSWHCRKLGTSDAWLELARGKHSRTASQTTAALSLWVNMSSLQMPDYPVELELRVKLLAEGTTGIKWNEKKFFNETGDFIQISATKNANYYYETT